MNNLPPSRTRNLDCGRYIKDLVNHAQTINQNVQSVTLTKTNLSVVIATTEKLVSAMKISIKIGVVYLKFTRSQMTQ